MREKVLALLQDTDTIPEEKYNSAMELYRKSTGNSPAAVNFYNRSGFTHPNLKNLCYDLQKLHGISDAEKAEKPVRKMIVVGAGKVAATMQEALDSMTDEVKNGVVILSTMASGDYPSESREVFDALGKFNEENCHLFVDEKGEQLYGDDYLKVLFNACHPYVVPEEVILKFKNAGKDPEVTLETVFTDAPDDVKTGIKLIEEFPFLDADDCPDKLKILVQDKFTAWRKYVAAHQALLVVTSEGVEPVAMTNEEIFELAKTAVENFQLNELIKTELKYYGEHKEVLGVHPIFADEKMAAKVNALSVAAAVTRRNNLRTYISRDTPKVEQAKTEAAATKLKEKLQTWTQELNLLNEKIGE